MAQQILIFAGVTTLLAGTIAFGVVYNTARVTLSERSRELSSLRVLGFTQGEAGFILLGELGFLTLLSLPLGAAMGKALCAVFMQSMQTDIFRIPLVLNPRTYAYAAVVILVSSLLSGIVIRRKINRLDLGGRAKNTGVVFGETHSENLTVLLISGIVGAAVYFSFAPRPVWWRRSRFRGGRSRPRSSKRARRGSSTATACPPRSRGTLSRMSFDVGDEVRAEPCWRGSIRCVPRRSTAAAARRRARTWPSRKPRSQRPRMMLKPPERTYATGKSSCLAPGGASRPASSPPNVWTTHWPANARAQAVLSAARATDRSGANGSRGRKSGFAVFGRPGVERVSRDRNGALSRERPYPQGPSGKTKRSCRLRIVAGDRRPRRP